MRNRSCIHSVSFGLSKAEAFPIKVCAQGIQDIGEQTFVKKKPQQVVAVMSGRLKPYLYFVLWCGAIPDSLQQAVESIHGVWNGKYIGQNFTLGVDDEAIVLIL